MDVCEGKERKKRVREEQEHLRKVSDKDFLRSLKNDSESRVSALTEASLFLLQRKTDNFTSDAIEVRNVVWSAHGSRSKHLIQQNTSQFPDASVESQPSPHIACGL